MAPPAGRPTLDSTAAHSSAGDLGTAKAEDTRTKQEVLETHEDSPDSTQAAEELEPRPEAWPAEKPWPPTRTHLERIARPHATRTFLLERGAHLRLRVIREDGTEILTSIEG